MLNLLRIFLGLTLLWLQGCQQKTSLNSESAPWTSKPISAAIYNTQLGLAYLNQGNRSRAKHKLLKALELDPKSIEANAAMAYFQESSGNLEEAQKYYIKVLSIVPKAGAQLNNYGSYLCRHRHYKEAEGYFLAAVKDVHYINTAGAYENAGLCAAAIPDYPKARHYFIQALNQDPQRKQSLYELVKIELEQNHTEKALALMQNYPKLSFNDPALLKLAIKASHRLGKTKLEKTYKISLNNLTNF
ncbi:MAG: type IV pilus biogenesis/stability protein PilW [Tatlockia sp.]|nr:type IV pilus biogenesis/stability protein PilW [Tatlockia sp.]